MDWLMRGRQTVVSFIKVSSSIFSPQFLALLLLMLFWWHFSVILIHFTHGVSFLTSENPWMPMIECYHPIIRRQLTQHIKIGFSNTYQSESYAHWFSSTSKTGSGKNVKAPWLRVKLTMGMPNRLNSRILGMDHRRSSHAAALSPNQWAANLPDPAKVERDKMKFLLLGKTVFKALKRKTVNWMWNEVLWMSRTYLYQRSKQTEKKTSGYHEGEQTGLAFLRASFSPLGKVADLM